MPDENDIKAYIGAIIFMSISPVCQLSHYLSNNERRHNSYMSSRISGSVRYQKCFIFRFPHRKLLVISFARFTIYMIFILYMPQIYLMTIVIYIYMNIQLSQIRPFLNVLERNFAKLYLPNKYLSIDEGMIGQRSV